MVSWSTRVTNTHKLRQLSREELSLLLQAVLLLPMLHIALSLWGYARVLRALEILTQLRSSNPSLTQPWTKERARIITRMVSIASQHGWYKATCLRKSMLTWWFLRREGIQSNICFGVRISDRELEAHAWVERAGVILNDSANVR